jgi:type I restriction enzyme S subunit
VCAIGQNLVLLRADGKKVSPKFLRWLVRGPGWWEQVRRFINVGAVFESLKCADIPNFRLLIPPLPEQTAISQVLGTLDDKIELNLQMNRTLEAMGKAIFKHWFISFEFPNEQGKFYKSSGGEMTYSEELGKEIPKGWKVGNILDCAEILSGGTPRTEVAKYWGGAVPWVTAKDVTNSQGSYILDTERTITQLGIENSNAKMIPKNTTVVTARGVVGSYCILSREMAINQTNYGLKAKPECGDFFVFFSVSNLVNQMNQHSYGTIFDTITTKTFDEMKIPLPSNSLIKSFEAKVAPTIARILLNLQESRSLVDIRDTLLPKLISARIRIPVEDA